MAKLRSKWLGLRSVIMVLINFSLAFAFVSAERRIIKGKSLRLNSDETRENESSFFLKAVNFLWESDQIGYRHVWPVSTLKSHLLGERIMCSCGFFVFVV